MRHVGVRVMAQAPVARVAEVFGLDRRSATLALGVGLVGIAVFAGLAVRFNAAQVALALLAAAAMAALGFRWPLVPLLAFAAMIPIEEIAVIEGLGTFSRLAGTLFAVAYALPRLSRLTPSAMPIGGWAFLAWSFLSLGWASSSSVAWAALVTLAQLFLIALLVANLVAERPEVVRPLLWAYSISAAGTAVLAVNLYLTQGAAETRAAALAGQDPAQFAAVMLPALGFGMHEALTGTRRLPGAAIAGLTTMAILVSGTRGAWLGAGVMMVILLAHMDTRKRIAALGVVGVVAAAALVAPGVADLVGHRVATALSSGGEGRTDIWTVGLLIYGHSPVVGFGYANFPVVYTLDLVRASGVGNLSAYVQGRGPHNLVLGTLVELGPIGILLLVLFFAPLLVRRGWGPNWPVLQASLAALLTSAMFLDILANRKQVWLVIGIAAGLQLAARRRAASQAPTAHEAPGTPGTAVDSTGLGGPIPDPQSNVATLARRPPRQTRPA